MKKLIGIIVIVVVIAMVGCSSAQTTSTSPPSNLTKLLKPMLAKVKYVNLYYDSVKYVDSRGQICYVYLYM